MSADIGTVRVWHDDEGWGVIDGPAVTAGCWAHFSSLAAKQFWVPTAGERVTFRWESADQDGFAARALSVWPVDEPETASTVGVQANGAYRSSLSIEVDA